MEFMMKAEINPLMTRVRDMVRAAGIDNFRFDQGFLVMCGVRYKVETCCCDEPDCNGLRLHRQEDGLTYSGNIAASQ